MTGVEGTQLAICYSIREYMYALARNEHSYSINYTSSAERCLIEAFADAHFKTRMVQVGIKWLQANRLTDYISVFSVVHYYIS